MQKNRRLLLQICILALCLSSILLLPNNTSVVSAKTTTLKELKKQKKENDKLRKKGGGYSYYLDVYKCKGNEIRQDSYRSGNGIVLTTYYKLRADGKTLKFICHIDKKSYFDEKTSTFKQKQSIQKANSSKYVKLSKKKLKKLDKKYKIIKAMWEKSYGTKANKTKTKNYETVLAKINTFKKSSGKLTIRLEKGENFTPKYKSEKITLKLAKGCKWQEKDTTPSQHSSYSTYKSSYKKIKKIWKQERRNYLHYKDEYLDSSPFLFGFTIKGKKVIRVYYFHS